MSHSFYFGNTLDRNRFPRLKKIVKVLEERFDRPTIVGIGLSGTILATSIRSIMNCNLCILRKEKSEHSSRAYEAENDFIEYLIVDDQICTGNTIKNIRFKLANKKCVGIVLHDTHGYGIGPYDGIPVFCFDEFGNLLEPIGE